jgi:hypothetical protein
MPFKFSLQKTVLYRQSINRTLDLMRRQDESDASRKNLIELIRGFKKNNPEEIRQEQLQFKAYSPVLI